MKKLFVLLLIFLTLYPAARSEPRLSVIELSAQLPDRWTETFPASYPAITVDVQPTVPDVQAMPVLKVRPAFWIPTADTEVPWHAQGVHFDQGGDAFTLEAGDVYGDENAATRRGNYTSVSTLRYAPFNLDAAYAPGNALTFGNVLDHLTSIMDDAQPAHFGIDTAHLLHLRVTSYSSRTGKVALPGSIAIDALTTLRGIPIFDHVLASIPSHRDDELSYSPLLSFTMRDKGSYSLLGRTVHETAEVVGDIPLCAFEDVRAAIIQEIDAGHIRAVYAVDLGYALYNVPGATRSSSGTTKAERRAWIKSAVFYAVPTWRCVCLYTEHSNMALPEKALVDPYPSMYFRTLFINAQTGEMIDPQDGRRGCADYPGAIAWP